VNAKTRIIEKEKKQLANPSQRLQHYYMYLLYCLP
jgi:hypothetical protein